jgi:hypothetical protein
MTTAQKPDRFQALRDATAAVLAPIGNMTDRHTAVVETMERRLAFQQACGPHTIETLLLSLSDAQASLLAKEAECEALREDAARWRTFEKVLARGLPGPAHKRQVRVIEICPMYGDEKEIANLRAAIDAARAAADQGGA